MKISLKWLNDYLFVEDYFSRPEELAELLTRAGLEVEEIENKQKDFANVVIGKVIEKGKHPNADKLSLCQVTTGPDQIHQIVCGAQNHKQGDLVVVALPGAILPGNFAIKKSQIRGVDSGGMLCSDKELGLANESGGIRILPSEAPIGESFAKYLGLDDVSFVLKVTPNRADCLSHYGLARELSCLLGRDLNEINPSVKEASTTTVSKIRLEVTAPDLCPRYTGKYIAGVKVGPSPEWLVRKLKAVGLNSINNIVDITNFVMMELGQPMHAFDAKSIEGGVVRVGRAQNAEKFTTLDGSELSLTNDHLLIQDEKKGLCVAGVIGGKNSGVTENTTDVFLESAYFLPMSVRKTSRSLRVETDSAYRFSRGVDPSGSKRALLRATELILQWAGGEALKGEHDFYPAPVAKRPIELNLKTISSRLGYAADENKFLKFMKGIGCEVSGNSEAWTVVPPSFRFDLEQDMDLVEEYARLNGYEHIPESLPALANAPSLHDKKYTLVQMVRERMISSGFNESFHFAFVGSSKQNEIVGQVSPWSRLGLAVAEDSISLLNPLSEDLNVMRKTLLVGMLDSLNRNFHYGNQSGSLFEVGKVFSKKDSNYVETLHMASVVWGKAESLHSPDMPPVLVLKAGIERLLNDFRITAYSWVQEGGDLPPFLHIGQSAKLVVEGKAVGFVGSLHPEYLMNEKIRVPAAVSEINLDQILRGQPRSYRYQGVSKYPFVERDFALVMDRQTPVGEVLREMKIQSGGMLVASQVFDIYEGDQIAAHQKSVAVRLRFQDKNATLQEEAITELQQKILSAIGKKFSAVIR